MFLYDTEAVYRLDRAAVETDGLSETELMGRAGARVWREISQRWPEYTRITVFAGQGNNGGDAFVVARLARQQGLTVQLISRGDLSRQSQASAYYKKLWLDEGGSISEWDRRHSDTAGKAEPQDNRIEGQIIIDGLLGIGIKRELDNDWQELIRAINQTQAIRVAIDIPSGLNANTGIAQPCAVEADLSVTFIAAKAGQYLADGPDYCGELLLDDLGISESTLKSQLPLLSVLDQGGVKLPALRKRNSHKNQFGHLLVIGGDRGMGGAARLAGLAALRLGAGMVSLAVHPDSVSAAGLTPELMVYSWDDLDARLALASILVVGPGLGQCPAAKQCLEKLSASDKPMVVDASALEADFLDRLTSKQVVITPHPGEAARLLSTDSGGIQRDRIAACRQLVDRFGFVCVLKGSGSLVQAPDLIPSINTRGNAGMAVAGMGDVLAGFIAALMGQGLEPFEAANTAVYVHALAAEEYARHSDESGLTASDLMHLAPRILKRLRKIPRVGHL